jgi:predicted transcriptional regulator
MSPASFLANLSRREREVLDLVYSLGEADAVLIQERFKGDVLNAGIRKILAGLLRKGAILRRKEGKKFIYLPAKKHESAAKHALRRIVDVFYGGSFAHGLMGMFEAGGEKFTEDELRNLKKLFEKKT